MNPSDFKRDIYGYNNFEINRVFLFEKIDNAKKVYSKALVDIVVKMLEEDH